MSDTDRKAFEAWYVLRCKAKSKPPRHGNDYVHADPTLTWHGWQAAREHYAPKLSEAQAIKVTAMVCAEIDYDEDYHADFEDVGLFIAQNWDGYSETAKAIIKALRAAGVRWKEEA